MLQAAEVLQRFGERLQAAKCLQDGHIAIHLSGNDGGSFFVRCGGGQVRITRDSPAEPARFELIGDASHILPVINGQTEARVQFLTRGFRIKGDLRYASDVGMELGLLKNPIFPS